MSLLRDDPLEKQLEHHASQRQQWQELKRHQIDGSEEQTLRETRLCCSVSLWNSKCISFPDKSKTRWEQGLGITLEKLPVWSAM